MTRRTPSQYNWPRLEFDETILTKHFSKRSSKTVKFIVVHHMTIVGNGSGSALTACYNTWQSREASAHYGVDGNLVRQFVWDKDYAWATGSTAGNENGISIEHANSTAGPKWLVSETTWKTGARLAANLHKVYKLGRPVKDKTLRKHSSFVATACPGPFLGGTNWSAYVKEAQRVYDEITATKPPVVVPPVQPVEVVTALQNIAGYNAPGQPGVTKYKTHVPSIAKAVLKSGADVFAVQEESNKAPAKMRPLLDARLKPSMTRAPGGTDGRYCYTGSDTKRVKSGNIVAAKSTWFNRDDKQAAWVIHTKSGARAMDVSFHLESDNGPVPDAKRVAQMLSILAQALVIAAKYKVPLENVAFFGDTNSEGMVAAAMKAAGWPAVANTKPTFRGWDGRSAKRFDYAFCKAGVKASLTVTKSDDSDHDRLTVKRQLAK